MIVVAVIALLGAVVLPAYQSQIRKAHRADAKASLTTAAQMMERYITEKSTYATATLGSGGVFADRSENGYYALALTDLSAATFTLTAAPQGSQASDPCGTYTLNQAGARGVTGGSLSAAECW